MSALAHIDDSTMISARPRVLVVEDEAIVALTLQQTLRKLGYNVGDTAATAEEALTLAAEQDPDLVLMDINLRGDRDGIEAATEIHRSHGIPIVFLTAFADGTTMHRSHAAEPHGYLVKPFEERELAATIETALRKSNLEARLRAAERRLSTVLHGIGDAVLATDRSGAIVFANAAAESLIDSPGPLLGRSVDDCLLLRDDTGRPEPPLAQAIEHGQVWSPTGHRTLECKSGASRKVSITVAPILDDDTATGCVLVLRDVSALVAREREIRQLQKMDALGRLAAGVAHDFNNLLTVIQGRAETALMRTGNDDGMETDAEEILRASKRGAGLVRQLLAFGRQSRPFMQREDLTALVVASHGLLRRLVGDHVTLEIEGDDAPRYIDADASLLDVVLMNLVINARDAMPDGGTVILRLDTVDAADAPPEERLLADHERCFSLEVVDDGEGMSADRIAHCFEPFFTTKQLGEGSGLGLSTSFAIISEHGGRIDVSSQLGLGTTMRVLLPAACSDLRAAPTRPLATDEPSTRGEVIAVVEDNSQIRTMVEQILEMRGYRVLSFPNGREALDAGDALDGIDLLLSDQSMPGSLTGLELADALRRRTPGLRVLLTSGFAPDAKTSARDDEDQLVEFLPKPFDAHELTARIRALLDRPSGINRRSERR